MIYRILILFLVSTSLMAQNSGDAVNVTDANGLKQGHWEKFYPESEVRRYTGQFKDDKPFGKFIYYYPSGQVQTVLIYRGDNRASAKNFHMNGKVLATGVYFGQLKDSTWTYFNEYDEKLAVEHYIQGKLYGNCLKFHRNGQLLEERYFENSLENGPYKEYFENGQLAREGTYVHGSLEGKAAFYHPNGQVRFEGEYVKDAKEGIWKTYDEEGNVTDERKYHKGIAEFRDSDLIFEDTTKYIKKDYLEIEDFIQEDYMEVPPAKEKGKKK